MQILVYMKEKGYWLCEDIVKVFVTSHPTLFDFLELLRLGESARGDRVDRGGEGDGGTMEDWAAVNFSIRILV